MACALLLSCDILYILHGRAAGQTAEEARACGRMILGKETVQIDPAVTQTRDPKAVGTLREAKHLNLEDQSNRKEKFTLMRFLMKNYRYKSI